MSEQLEQLIYREFIKQRHGVTKKVILMQVRRDKVVLRDRTSEETFTLSQAKFQKFFKLTDAEPFVPNSPHGEDYDSSPRTTGSISAATSSTDCAASD